MGDTEYRIDEKSDKALLECMEDITSRSEEIGKHRFDSDEAFNLATDTADDLLMTSFFDPGASVGNAMGVKKLGDVDDEWSYLPNSKIYCNDDEPYRIAFTCIGGYCVVTLEFDSDAWKYC